VEAREKVDDGADMIDDAIPIFESSKISHRIGHRSEAERRST
jgi:hypothetical protein